MDPSNPSTVYAGTTLGGVCVSTDSGAHWAQMNEGLNHTDIGTIAVSPSGDTLYAATCGGVFDYETG